MARSFLHNQVRSMVGSLVPVGDGKWTADDRGARARRARPRRLRAGRAARGALSGAGGLPDSEFVNPIQMTLDLGAMSAFSGVRTLLA